MIVQSVRLKNIKSYGDGPDGNGITVSFQPGVNRVGGRNGYGKTTLIEALGYALFCSEPHAEENFRLPTYFLRAGEKEAEMDVVFSHEGQTYRLERGLGQTRRKRKVIQLSDQSTCAQDDAEVEAFLCRLLGFKEQRQLSDLFSSLIGVKQGRLTRPFDSKPAAAKEFYEPLLDVAIFRETTWRLSQAQGRFKDLLEERNHKLAAVTERIRERADSQDKVAIQREQVERWRKRVEISQRQKEEAEKRKQACEQKQAAFNGAKSALAEANHQLELAAQKRAHDQNQLVQAQAANQTVCTTQPGYQAYSTAEERLRVLQQQQSEKSRLQHQRAEALNARTECESKKAAAQGSVKELNDQKVQQAKLLDNLRQQVSDGAKAVEGAKAQCQKLSLLATAARRFREDLGGWVESLAERVEAIQSPPGLDSCGWDFQPIIKARSSEHELAEATLEWERKVNRAEQSKQTLVAQLAQIAGGVCPFLKEKCRQFDPKAVQSDLSEREKELAEAGRQREQATRAYKVAKKASADAISELFKLANEKLDQARGQFETQERERISAESDLKNSKRNFEETERALKELSARIEESAKHAGSAGEQAESAAKRVAELDEKLRTFANLEQELDRQQAIKEKTTKDHKLYLQSQPLAARLEAFQETLKTSSLLEERAQALSRQKAEQMEQAGRDFDPAALTTALDGAAEARSKLATEELQHKSAENDLKKEEERLKDWKEACAEGDKIEHEIGRLMAAGSLARLAGKVLKDSAPAVAQQLCSRIAANAQRIFNQINHEAIELEWKAEPQYSFRIVPGDRRFAMLSGGEQTKLALAMTLAMIQQFSSLRFALFDEPTYAVDADSRQRLADAIIEAQKAAGLDQLIIVSHDDAFEGKIENVVMLRKTAGVGTEVVAE